MNARDKEFTTVTLKKIHARPPIFFSELKNNFRQIESQNGTHNASA
jgi:hypothetical protein